MMIRIINLLLILCWCSSTVFAQFADPAVTGANFAPNTINTGATSVLTISFANTGATPIPANSIELTISTAANYYTSGGVTAPGGVGGNLFTWTYLGVDIWRGTNASMVPAFGGGNITLQVTGDAISPSFEVTNINVQPVSNFNAFLNASANDNLQPELKIAAAGSCSINLVLWLEGPYEPTLNEMRTDLNDQQLLPGQNPIFLLGEDTPAGQPYDIAPWLYDGTEGDAYDFNTVGNDKANYNSDVVDWVLVSLRTSPLAGSTICTEAAWLMKDGTVMFPDGCNCPLTIGQELYIVVEHRNHLPIMTPTAQTVIGTGLSFDFRNQESFLTFTGDGQKILETGVFGMFAANGDQTSTIGSRTDVNATDESIWTGSNSEGDIYNIGDHNLDGDVNANDESLWLDDTGKSSDVNFN